MLCLVSACGGAGNESDEPPDPPRPTHSDFAPLESRPVPGLKRAPDSIGALDVLIGDAWQTIGSCSDLTRALDAGEQSQTLNLLSYRKPPDGAYADLACDMEQHGHYVDGLAVFRFPDADRSFEIHAYMRIRLADGRRLIVYSNIGPYTYGPNGPWDVSSMTVINPQNGLSRWNRVASGRDSILDPLGVYLTTGDIPPEFDNLLNAPPLNATRTRGLIVRYFQEHYPEVAQGERSDGFVLWHTVSGIGHNGSGAANDLMAGLGQVAGMRQTSDMMVKIGIDQVGDPVCVELDASAHECEIDLAMSMSITPWQYAGGSDAGLINWMFRQGFGASNQAVTPEVRRFKLVFHDDGRQLTFEPTDELDGFLGISQRDE